jgi:Family of unknown function (DUF5908)
MAIEIREVVIKATVRQTIGEQVQYLTKSDLSKIQDRITERILKKMKTLLEESRSSR